MTKQARNIAAIWQMRQGQVEEELAKREREDPLLPLLRSMEAAILANDVNILVEAGEDWFARTQVIPPAFVGTSRKNIYFPGQSVPTPEKGEVFQLQPCHPQLYR